MTKHRIVSLALAAALAPAVFAQGKKGTAPWRTNVNLFGGDYRSIDMDTADPTGCKVACENEAQCKAWSFVKPVVPRGRAYCWLKDSVPEASRDTCCVSALKGEGGGGSSGGGQGATVPASPAWRGNTNFPGLDYKSIDMNTNNPGVCKAACDREAQCVAWTFVKPVERGGPSACWLKEAVPEAVHDTCCVSALKGVATGGSSGGGTGATGRWRVNTNLPGGDYKSIDMNTNNPGACLAACNKEAQCRAWTFVKPEEPGGNAYCWLKDSVPEATSETCCVSAVKGEARSDDLPRPGGRKGRRQ